MARNEDDDIRDDDDRPRRRSGSGGGSSELTGMDKFFANTPLVIILALVFCLCTPIGIILGGIGTFTCKNPTSKRNATIMLVIDGVVLVIGIIGQLSGAIKQ